MEAHASIDTQGKPWRVTFRKMLGAFPFSARPSIAVVSDTTLAEPGERRRKADVQSARELLYKSLFAADHAEVRIAALII